ncbi:DNA2-like helicase [Phytophthora megakarya]|uniref:DNA2-like helicase n=1 Tax=Phytophthora megakarya TaxID=4795 RepID=A0A225VPD1_9STRA|nr:DNA2-like helicase [Phytophthora megakarya]
MDSSWTPKRKRRRVEAAAPRRGKNGASSVSRASGTGATESKIVWKDSPADKQIQVSGTGKMAVRREMQGFVGRLARASQQSPYSSSEEEKKLSRERGRTRRKAVGTLQYEEEKAASRPLMFSPAGRVVGRQRTPNTVRRRRSTEKGGSQDELFSVLDQMEQKYASPDVAVTLTGSRMSSPTDQQQIQLHPLPPAIAITAGEVNLTPTPAYSYSSTGTLSLQTQETVMTQDVTKNQDVTATLTTGKGQNTKIAEKPIVVGSDPFDDLTDESWALLEQMESQRAPIEASQPQSPSQTELVSSQNVALTPRPMPSVAYGELKKPPPAPVSSNTAAVVQPMHSVDETQQLDTPESYKRFLVLEADRDIANRSLTLRLLDDQDAQLEAMLSDDWYDVLIEAGDTINIIFTEQDKDGLFSQDRIMRPFNQSLPRILVDNAHNIVVVHPDILVRSVVFRFAAYSQRPCRYHQLG